MGTLERERDTQCRRVRAAAEEAQAAGDAAALWQGRAAGLTLQVHPLPHLKLPIDRPANNAPHDALSLPTCCVSLLTCRRA